MYYTREAFLADLEAVLDAAGVGRTAFLGWSEGGSLAIAFAAAHPERVERLVLYGAYAKRYAAPGYPVGGDQARGEAVLQLVCSEWELGSRVLADIFVPEADAQRVAWFTA
jgi:pimeloyl-ACP methyl ester carboxylesterase